MIHKNYLNNASQKWFTNIWLTKLTHKKETLKNDSQNLDSKKWFTNFKLTKMIHKNKTHKN